MLSKYSQKDKDFSSCIPPICIDCQFLISLKKVVVDFDNKVLLNYECKCSKNKIKPLTCYLHSLQLFLSFQTNKNKALYYCIDCKKYINQSKLKSHCEHMLLDCEIKNLNDKCKKHLNQKENKDLYCKKCNVYVCSKCKLETTKHNKHQIINIAKQYNQKNEEIKKINKEIYIKNIKNKFQISKVINDDVEIQLGELYDLFVKSFLVFSTRYNAPLIESLSNFENVAKKNVPIQVNSIRIGKPFAIKDIDVNAKKAKFKLAPTDYKTNIEIMQIVPLKNKTILIIYNNDTIKKGIFEIYDQFFRRELYHEEFICYLQKVCKINENEYLFMGKDHSELWDLTNIPKLVRPYEHKGFTLNGIPIHLPNIFCIQDSDVSLSIFDIEKGERINQVEFFHENNPYGRDNTIRHYIKLNETMILVCLEDQFQIWDNKLTKLITLYDGTDNNEPKEDPICLQNFILLQPLIFISGFTQMNSFLSLWDYEKKKTLYMNFQECSTISQINYYKNNYAIMLSYDYKIYLSNIDNGDIVQVVSFLTYEVMEDTFYSYGFNYSLYLTPDVLLFCTNLTIFGLVEIENNEPINNNEVNYNL